MSNCNMDIKDIQSQLSTAARLTGSCPEWTHLTATIVRGLEAISFLQSQLVHARSALSDIETAANRALETTDNKKGP